MYVSGTLKNRTVDFYKSKMFDFDDKAFYTDDISVSYDGAIIIPPWDSKKLETLNNKQNKYIKNGIERIHLLIMEKRILNIEKEVLKIIDLINNTNRNISFKLFEAFYKILNLARSYKFVLYNINRFHILIDHLNKLDNIKQVDLDIIIDLFLRNLSYDEENIVRAKIDKFKIDERDIDDTFIYKLVLLGEFIAPDRLSIVSSTLTSYNEFTKYVVPIYFSIKDDRQAELFLRYCRTYDLNFEQIEKNALRCRVPNNLINMVRR